MNIYVLPHKWKHNILGCVEAATLDEALYVLSCSQHKTFKDDGIRSMAAPFEVREQTFLTQCQLYSEFGIEYEVLSESYYENFCKIRNYIIAT